LRHERKIIIIKSNIAKEPKTPLRAKIKTDCNMLFNDLKQVDTGHPPTKYAFM